MQNFYANTNNPLIDNYQHKWIADFEHLLLGVQREITTGAVLNRAIRQLHPEPYASLVNVNFDILDQFVRNRERNSVSALFQVETEEYARAIKTSLGISSTVALASPAAACGEDILNIQQFVENPVRYWVSGFGQKGNQKRYNDEYGFDTEVWGTSIGVIKECGDTYYGLTAGYGRARTNFDDLNAWAVTHAYMGEMLYGVRRELGFMELFGSYGYHEQKVDRFVNMANGFYTGRTRGEYHDNVFNMGVRFGYQHVFGQNWLLIPTIGLQYSKSENGKFTEKARHDMSVAFKFDDKAITREVYKVPVTVRLNKSFVIRDFVVTPEVRAGGTLYFGKRNAKATTMYVGMPISNLKFTAYGVDAGRYEAMLGASIELSRY
ncbi:MAG: autotransporter outer membrane beta-barrel domain-containing protein, partial [Clostridium sp.]|nr:autotransporter outer membrane beta-barrel domain-containing protein [Clostridium sp.]